MDWQRIVPAAPELAHMDLGAAREIRLQPGQPVWARMENGWWRGETPLSPQDILMAAQALSDHSLAARHRELARGFLPLPGGHRLGVCGEMDDQGMRQITSLCVRVCHAVDTAAEGVFPRIQGHHTLIIGPPGSGKTTLLRDIVRRYGLAGWPVGLCDERGEIAACQNGAPQLDVGPLCDVVTGLEKPQALTLLLRSMAPRVLAADELGDDLDARALQKAAAAGVVIVATVHASNEFDWLYRPGCRELAGVFRRLVVLSPDNVPTVVEREETP